MKVFVFEEPQYAFIHEKWLDQIPEYTILDRYMMKNEILETVIVHLYINGANSIGYVLLSHPMMSIFIDNLCNIHGIEKYTAYGNPVCNM